MANPQIPERFFSLLGFEHQEALNKIKERKVSATSRLSHASSTDFIHTKIVEVSTTLEYAKKLRLGLLNAFNQGLIPEKQYNETIQEVEVESRPYEQEIVVLKRQKKIVTEDLQDQVPFHAKMEDVYASIITNKVMGAVVNRRKSRSNQSRLKAKVLEYYNAYKIFGDPKSNDRDSYCHLTGWQHDTLIKAVHIVPKLLQSDELSYLFGVGEAVLSDPRNCMSFTSIISGIFRCSKS